ncbi:MAG: hypothetical protein ABL872_08430 [Lacibacter sp.]
MKKTAITAICIFIFFTASAQFAAKTDSMPVTGKLNAPLYNSSRILGNSDKGIVYALPLDNMPALRPDTTIKYNMPVAGYKQKPRILTYPKLPEPNPLLQRKQKDSLMILTPFGPKQIIIH